MTSAGGRVLGVDGCRSGWIAVSVSTDGPLDPRLRFAAHFRDLLPGACAKIGVDMPIGLPERITGPGRAAEQAVRPLLGERQSSVFSVPSRAAVMADTYEESCRIALATSTPPRKVSRQCWHLFPKVRELDALLMATREAPVYETHPEVGFWRLNRERPMSLPKKVKSAPNRPGIAERIGLLVAHGFDAALFDQQRPPGVGLDDLVDAAVNALTARRLFAGLARPFPDPPDRDTRGLPIAIWA